MLIVDLNLRNKSVLVIGGGKEAEKRINSLLRQNCKITVVSPNTTAKINKLSKQGKIYFIKEKIENAAIIEKSKHDMVITTTNDAKVNQKILSTAKKKKILAYSSDDPDSSDFSNPAIIDFERIIQIAIFTGGKSPMMSKKIKNDIKKILKKTITKQDIAQIKIQQIARSEVKKTDLSQSERKSFLSDIMADNTIKQLIKDGQLKRAEKRAITLLSEKNE